MAKIFAALLLGFMLAPSFISAENVLTKSIVGNPCLVRVYHTNFMFPPEGGRIIQIGQELFFWKNYLPECASALPSQTPVVVTSSAGVPRDPYNLGGDYGQQIVGNPCAIRVYHTNFMFPPEGGKIVQAGQDMYFIKTGQAGCASAGANLPVLKQSGATPVVTPSFTTSTPTVVTQTVAPTVPANNIVYSNPSAPMYTLAGSATNSSYTTAATPITSCVQQ